MLRYAILGCGPAGLLAAHAVRTLGHEPIIFSKKAKSIQYGAQWLHEPIPGITSAEPDGHIEVIHRGDAHHYATKVYGNPAAPTSFGVWGRTSRVTHLPIWDLRSAYARLWDDLEGNIRNITVEPHHLHILTKDDNYDGIISAIPARALCRSVQVNPTTGDVPDAHEFFSQAAHVKVGTDPQDRNFVIYNGDKAPSWYRTSLVFGHSSMEWGDHIPGGKPPVEGVQTIEKPINTTCDCWSEIHRVGRYGMWKKGVLAHDAFLGALDYVGAATDTEQLSFNLPSQS